MALAAPLAKLGRLDEARDAGRRVLELQPTFRSSVQLRNVGAVPSFAAEFSEALGAAGLPE
jgi:adenylate cyclase